jgi:phenylacetate-CoA ligase
VLDPDTLQPMREGERGELVLTTLRKSARPMISFRTGDIVSFTSEPCRCGRTPVRMHRVHGRLDDMLIIKGVNIFPSDFEALARGDTELTGEYQLVVDRVGHLDKLTVEIERRQGFNGTDAALAERFSARLKAVTGVSAEVSVLAPESLPRATHKAKRVIDLRTRVCGLRGSGVRATARRALGQWAQWQIPHPPATTAASGVS